MVPNYLRPPPEVIGQEDDHYEVETNLAISTNQEPSRNPVSWSNGRVTQTRTTPGTSLPYEERRKPCHRLSTNDTPTFHSLQTLQEQ